MNRKLVFCLLQTELIREKFYIDPKSKQIPAKNKWATLLPKIAILLLFIFKVIFPIIQIYFFTDFERYSSEQLSISQELFGHFTF